LILGTIPPWISPVSIMSRTFGRVSHHDQLFGFQSPCDLGGGLVSVDVEGVPVPVDPDGSHDRDVPVTVQKVENLGVHRTDAADMSQGVTLPFPHQKVSVPSCQSYGPAPPPLDQGHQFPVDLSGKDHLDDFHRRAVGNAQAVHEPGLHPESLHQPRDFRPPSVHHDGPYPDMYQENEIVGKGQVFRARAFRFFRTGASPVLDHERLSRKRPDIGQRFDQDSGLGLAVFQTFLPTAGRPCCQRI
jgi:hypothetical protein